MKLRVFASWKQQASTSRRLVAATSTSTCTGSIISHDGVVARSLKEAATMLIEQQPQERWICHLSPNTASDAARMLDQLHDAICRSSLETNNNSNSNSNSNNDSDSDSDSDNDNDKRTMVNLPEMIVFGNKKVSSSVEDSLPYLREILPLGAQFLEAHPTIASNYGRLNAHGKALNDHVVGICHSFPTNHSISDLAVLLDVFLPTRLAVSHANLLPLLLLGPGKLSYGTTKSQPSWNDDDEWETVIQNTDLVFVSSLEEPKKYIKNYKHSEDDYSNTSTWKPVWDAQAADGANESYVIRLSSSDEDEKITIPNTGTTGRES